MPVVPFSTPSPQSKLMPQRDPPSEAFAMMAAAQMHSEGRLIEPNSAPKARPDAR